MIDYDYDPTTGNLSTITAPDETLSYTYDGSLLRTTTWSGDLSGSVEQTYDNDFRVITRSVNGMDAVSFGYDDDGLLTSAGALSITRIPGNGFLDTTTLGMVTTNTDYNGFGEVSLMEAEVSGTPVYRVDPFTRDDLGRIRFKTETIGGETHAFEYQYDLGGRLDRVLRDDVLIADYDYDANGNRTAAPNLTGIPDYDDQDRLITYGLNSYTYTDNGELLTKTTPSGTTTYGYDALGNLSVVVQPDGTVISYVIDGNNRRVGKRVGGVLTQGFLYKDQLNPIAELNPDGSVLSRFVYGEVVNVPAYMVRGGVTYRIVSDHLGSPRLVVNTADGSIIQRMDYDEFGNVTLDTSPGFQPFGFAGGLYDRDTGLTRFGARDYDPEKGRWTAKDPIGFDGKDTNLYGYVFNDPINLLDLDGKMTIVGGATGIDGGPAVTGTAITDTTGICGGLSDVLPTESGVLPTSRRCMYIGEVGGAGGTKTCMYQCRGYGAIATFPWPSDQQCPDSFNGNFPGP